MNDNEMTIALQGLMRLHCAKNDTYYKCGWNNALETVAQETEKILDSFSYDSLIELFNTLKK